MKRSLVLLLVFVFVSSPVFGETGASGIPDRLRPAEGFPYRLEPRREALLIASGLGFTITGFALDQLYETTTAAEYAEDTGFDKDDVFYLDRLLMRPYSEIGQNTAHALFFVTLLTPFPTIVH